MSNLWQLRFRQNPNVRKEPNSNRNFQIEHNYDYNVYDYSMLYFIGVVLLVETTLYRDIEGQRLATLPTGPFPIAAMFLLSTVACPSPLTQ